MLKQAQIEKLLNRSLTSAEVTNLSLYLKIATQRLEELLCMDICGEAGERTYDSRYGYRTVFTDPFTSINSITIDDEVVSEDDFVVKLNERYSGNWFNSIEFDTKRRGQKIVIDAEWGFNKLPEDLQLLLAQLFAQGSTEQVSDAQVKSKKIEDFSVTYKDSATYDEFVSTHASVLNKYAQCNQNQIRHGAVGGYYGLRSIR